MSPQRPIFFFTELPETKGGARARCNAKPSGSPPSQLKQPPSDAVDGNQKSGEKTSWGWWLKSHYLLRLSKAYISQVVQDFWRINSVTPSKMLPYLRSHRQGSLHTYSTKACFRLRVKLHFRTNWVRGDPKLHPWKWTWNTNNGGGWKMMFLFKQVIFSWLFHVPVVARGLCLYCNLISMTIFHEKDASWWKRFALPKISFPKTIGVCDTIHSRWIRCFSKFSKGQVGALQIKGSNLFLEEVPPPFDTCHRQKPLRFFRNFLSGAKTPFCSLGWGWDLLGSTEGSWQFLTIRW